MKKFVYFVLSIVMAAYMVVSTGTTVYATEAGEDTSIENGQKIYQNFLNVSAFIENDSKWSDTMKQYENGGTMKEFFSSYYEDLIDSSTEIQYEELSTYETFIYVETYLQFANVANTTLKERYINDSKNSANSFMEIYCALWPDNDEANAVKEAYHDLVEWQFAYIRENNFPYNFITDKTYAEETGLLPDDTPQETNKEEQELADQLGITEEEIEEIKNALTEEEIEDIQETVNDSEEEKSIWAPVWEKLGEIWFTLLILALFVVAYFVVKHIRKKTDIDELSDSGR